MIFNPNWYDNSYPDGVAVLEIIAAGKTVPTFIPLTRTLLEGSIDGPLADFSLTHIFGIRRKPIHM